MADRSKSSSYNSQAATIASLSFFEKLGSIPSIVSVFANAIVAILTGRLRSKSRRPDSYFRYVALTALRTMTRALSARQQHYIIASTDDAYIVACKKRGFTPNSEVLKDGTQAHWVGSSKAESLILNLHGGGYVVPASPEMFEFMFQIVDFLKAKGKDVAVLMLSYDLAPGQVYPRQLQQASLLLSHVINNLSVSPSNIILAGDSAGANLVLGLLSHISHPHPSVLPITLSGPIRGTVLISPWVTFSTNAASFSANKYKDCLDPVALDQWKTAFLGSSSDGKPNSSDYYNEADKAPESWWKGLKVQDVLILAGEDEVFVDGITEFEGKFRRGVGESTNVEFLVAKGEYHDQPSIDIQFGYTEHGAQATRLKRWVDSKL